MSAPAHDLLAEGRAALRRGDAPGARAALERAMDESPSGDVVEALAQAAYLELDFPTAIDAWEHAYARYRAAGEPVGAIRMARTLAYLYFSFVGDPAVAGGWISRAQTLLAGVPDSPEAGWVALNLGMFDGDRDRKEARFREALAVARGTDDVELELAALAYLGASLVHRERIEEGMLLLDEALAGVAGREVDDLVVLEEIFCQLFAACEHARDVGRADQWIRIGEALAARRNLPAVSAFCRTHYGGVLTAAGRWPEADATLTEAVRLWGLGRRSNLRVGALVRLADLRVRQGRLEEAEQLLAEVAPYEDPVGGRAQAAIDLARGEPALAVDRLEQALAQLDPASTTAVPFLLLLVDARLQTGDLEGAGAAADALGHVARARPDHDYPSAAAALAQGQVCLATGAGDPQACLREALAGFSRARMPMELARSRLALADALVAERPEVALVEARAALDGFERLQAARDVDAASALLRSMGVRPPAGPRGTGVLSRREAEVLELVGLGLSNPEIAARLYISRKTVEHHVGAILAKLGLRSRAEAAAYSARSAQGPVAGTETGRE